MSEIECRLQEDPEYNNSYVMKSLRKRGIKIEPPSIDLLANGMNLTYTPSTSTEDMSLESSQGSSSDYIFTQYGRRSSSLADELYYIDQKEFNMELTSRLKESVEDLESQAQNYNEEREVNENEIAKRLIQRQNIYATSNIETNVEMLDYLQLPIGVNDYETLESHELFPALRDEFLKDIHELKRLAKYFVQDQYDHQIDIFYENVRITDETFKEDFFILYKETRFHIRCLLTKLQRYQDDESSDIILKDYIALALHECLVGIDLCPAGVYERFKHTSINLSASGGNMKKKIFSLRETLFYQCIQSFMTECERNGLDIPIDMDVHWNSGFYNIFCDSLNLPPSKDRFAVQYIGTNLRNDFISLVQLDVSRSSITRKLWNDWSDQFSDILKSEGASSWETEDINLSGSSLKIIDALDNKLLKPISSLLGVEVKDALNIQFLLDDKGNDTHSPSRYRELLLFWIVSHLNISKDKRQRESKVSVLSALSKRTSPPPLFRNS